MIRTPSASARWLVLALLLGTGLSACGGDSTATSPEESDPAPEVLEAMDEAILDEFRAEMTYRTVLDTFGEVFPFANIVNAEVRHSEALAGLYLRRGLPVPADPWTPGDIPVFASVAEACQAGVAAEIANAAIYDGTLGLALPADVRQVFQNNRNASVQQHLPAFQRCS